MFNVIVAGRAPATHTHAARQRLAQANPTSSSTNKATPAGDTRPAPSAITSTVPKPAAGFINWVSSCVSVETSEIPILTAREDVPRPDIGIPPIFRTPECLR
jgi:hypothetical protein